MSRSGGGSRRPFFLLILPLVLLSLAAVPARAEGATSLLSRPDFFPLAVWLQTPAKAEAYKKLGINLYVGLWEGPTHDQLATLKAAGMPVFSPENEVGLTDPNRDIIAGWTMQDEPDNAQPRKSGSGFGPPIPPAEMIARYRAIKKQDASRPVLLNLGQGVAWDGWYGRGVRTNHPEDYAEYVKAGDIVSFDIYPATHYNPDLRGRLGLVAKGVERLVAWTGGKKPVWSVIGASRVDNPNILPSGDQIRSMVWLSIIHGARGIIYFVHEFAPRFVEAGLLQHPELVAAVTKINARITSLAPVLNSASLVKAVTVTTDPSATGPAAGSVTALVKQSDCHLYIFAGSRSGLKGRARLSLTAPAGFENAKADVLDEGREISLRDGSFEDGFGPYAVHLYRIDRPGTACSG